MDLLYLRKDSQNFFALSPLFYQRDLLEIPFAHGRAHSAVCNEERRHPQVPKRLLRLIDFPIELPESAWQFTALSNVISDARSKVMCVSAFLPRLVDRGRRLIVVFGLTFLLRCVGPPEEDGLAFFQQSFSLAKDQKPVLVLAQLF